MERVSLALVIVALVTFVATVLGRRFIRRSRAKHAGLMRAKLSALRSAVRHWPGPVEDLVRIDSDRQRGSHSFRTIELRPCPEELWRVLILVQEQYRLEIISAKDHTRCYPAVGTWSDEPWLKKEIDLLLWELDALSARQDRSPGVTHDH
ncbi:MAG: hypothetical protein QY323_05310 [Patescibacteria group bacterium]|nr:MAG: hypothetical protein QY323_05310 [Patescibacteria group bacterium]